MGWGLQQKKYSVASARASLKYLADRRGKDQGPFLGCSE